MDTNKPTLELTKKPKPTLTLTKKPVPAPRKIPLNTIASTYPTYGGKSNG